MNDRELLELAAKAAGIEGGWGPVFKIGDDEVDVSDIWFLDAPETGSIWDPLTDDGDALRLAMKLGISMNHEDHGIQGGVFRPIDIYLKIEFIQKGKSESDRPELTRRLFVMVAAEIGRAMQ